VTVTRVVPSRSASSCWVPGSSTGVLGNAAGPWADDSGALLVFDVERPELDRILDADPYHRMPGVEVVGVREWVPVVGLLS
jgi:hypothetical protein